MTRGSLTIVSGETVTLIGNIILPILRFTNVFGRCNYKSGNVTNFEILIMYYEGRCTRFHTVHYLLALGLFGKGEKVFSLSLGIAV